MPHNGFFQVHRSDGYGNNTEFVIRAADVSAIEYGRSDAYRGIAGVKIILANGEVITSSDSADYVRRAFEDALCGR